MSVSGTPTSGTEAQPRETPPVEDASAPAPTVPSERGLTLAPGTWNVAGFDPRVVKALTVLGFALPAIAYIALIQHYQVNAIWQDQWDDVTLIRHFPSWSALWNQHTDNRILFPNLIVVALAHTVHYNIKIEEYLSALMLFGATALFIWLHKRRSPNTPLLFYCPVAFLTLTLSQWQNALWGFQMAWYLVLLSLAVTMALLDRPQVVGPLGWPLLAWPTFVVAALAAVVGSYSSVQGLLIWPVGLVLLYHRRWPRWAVVGWIVAAGVTAGLYFHSFATTRVVNPSYVLSHAYHAVAVFLFALGDVVGVQERLHDPPNAAVMAFGIATFVLAVFVLLRWGIRRDESSGAPIGIALIVFGLLFDAMVTQGRYWLNFYAASMSHYTTYDVLVLVGIYLTVLSGSPLRVGTKRDARRSAGGGQPQKALAWTGGLVERIDRRAIRRVALAAIVIQVVFSVPLGIRYARGFHQVLVTTASVTANIQHEPDAVVVADLYYIQGASWLRAEAQYAREHHLSQFG